MENEQVHILNAKNQISEYVNDINQAVESGSPDEVRELVTVAMPFGQDAIINLEEADNLSDDPEVSERIGEAMNHLGMSVNFGDEAIKASDDEVMNVVVEMKRHADLSTGYLDDVISIAS